MYATYTKGDAVELRVLNSTTDIAAPTHTWARGVVVRVNHGKVTVNMGSYRCRVALDSTSMRKVPK